MASATRDPGRRIPDDIAPEDTAFLVGFQDLLLIFGAGTGVFMVVFSVLLLPFSVSVGAGVAAGVAALAVVFLRPDDMTSLEWLETFAHHARAPDTLIHARWDTERHAPKADLTAAHELGRDAADVTGVDEVFVGQGAVRLEDGRVYTSVRVEPTDVSLATAGEREDLAEDFEQYLDTRVEGPVCVHVTSRPFDVDGRLRRLRDRRGDPDVRENPVMAALTDEHIQWYPEYLRQWGTFVREYRVFYPVSRADALGGARAEETVVEQLVDVPVVGAVVARLADANPGHDEAEVLARQVRLAAERADRGVRGLRALEGVDTRRESAAEMAVAIREFWTGRQVDADPEDFVPESGTTVAGPGLDNETVARATGGDATTDPLGDLGGGDDAAPGGSAGAPGGGAGGDGGDAGA